MNVKNCQKNKDIIFSNFFAFLIEIIFARLMLETEAESPSHIARNNLPNVQST